MAGLARGGGPEDLARTLAGLRAEVEAQTQTLELDKEELRGRLRGVEAQRLELDAQVRQEELRLAQLRQRLETERAARDTDAAAREVLSPAVRSSLAAVRRGVQSGLPYRQAERLGELDRLQAQLDGGESSPREVAARLWSFTEDELRLTRENAVSRQVILLEGQPRLVEVARLGMAAAFYRTDSGEVGRAERREGGWVWTPLSGDLPRQQVGELFLALSRQVRSGPFTLPLEVNP